MLGGIAEVVAGLDAGAAEEVGGVEGFSADELEAEDLEGAGAGGDEEAVAGGFENLAGGAGAGGGGGLVDDEGGGGLVDGGAVPVGGGDGPGLHGADVVVDGEGGAGPVDPAVFLAELGGSGDEGFVLGDDGGVAGDEVVDGLRDEGSAELGDAGFEFAGGFVGVDGGAGDGDHAAGVDAGGHLDDGDAGFGVAVLDGAGDGGRASVAGEDGAVEIDPAETWEGQDLGGEDLAVGGGDEEVDIERLDEGDAVGGVDAFGLLDADAVVEGGLFDAAGDGDLLAALGAVGLGDEGDDGVGCFEEAQEGGEGEVAGAEHGQADGVGHGRGGPAGELGCRYGSGDGGRAGGQGFELAGDVFVGGIGTAALGFAEGGFDFLDFGLEGLEGFAFDVVDEELAVEVVGFVLDGAAEEVFGVDVDVAAFEVEGTDADALGAVDGAVDAGEGEAAFFLVEAAVALGDLGVDEDEFLVFLGGVGGDVEDEELEGEADLVGGEADAPGFVHQVEHGSDLVLEGGVDAFDGFRLVAQGGVGVGDDPQHVGSPCDPRINGVNYKRRGAWRSRGLRGGVRLARGGEGRGGVLWSFGLGGPLVAA